MNYFSELDYLGQGVCPAGPIIGFYPYIQKASLISSAQLKNLPTDKPIVVFCWTGQNSSQISAFLNIPGYETYSLKLGVNEMVYGQLTANKWSTKQITGLPFIL